MTGVGVAGSVDPARDQAQAGSELRANVPSLPLGAEVEDENEEQEEEVNIFAKAKVRSGKSTKKKEIDDLPTHNGIHELKNRVGLFLFHLALGGPDLRSWLLTIEPIFVPSYLQDSPLRKFTMEVVSHKAFETIIIFAIILNCLVMMLDHPLDFEPELVPVFAVVEICFMVIYTIEMTLKILAMGFVLHKGSYLRDKWNILDFIVVVSSYFSLLPGLGFDVSFIRTFRILRAAKAVSFFDGLRILVTAILRTFPLMKDVFAITAFILALLGLLGMQLFSGNLRYRCMREVTPGAWVVDDSVEHFCKAEIIPGDTFACPVGTTCMDGGVNPNWGVTGYDNIWMAFITIIQCASLEGWTDVMYMLVETTNKTLVVFFNLAIVVIVAYILVSLMTGVVVTSYMSICEEDDANEAAEKAEAKHEREEKDAEDKRQNDKKVEKEEAAARASAADKAKQESLAIDVAQDQNTLNAPESSNNDKNHLATPHQNHDHHYKRTVIGEFVEKLETMDAQPAKQKPTEGYQGPSTFFNKLAKNDTFEKIMLGFIMLNTLFLTTYYYEISEPHEMILEIGNYIFTAVFTFELIVKLLGFGFKGFAADSFNVFDAVVVFLSYLEIVLVSLGEDSVGISAFRALRALRAVKLVKVSESIRLLVSVLTSSFSRVGWFCILLILFFFIFVLLGVDLFAGKLIDPDGVVPRMNFDSRGWSWVVVFLIVTGENWNDVLYLTSKDTGLVGQIYCTGLFVVGNYFIFNIFLAILLSNFDEDDDEEEEEFDEVKIATLRSKTIVSRFGGAFGAEHRKTLWGISGENKIRKFCITVSESERFEMFIMGVIAVSTFLLFFQDAYYSERPAEFKLFIEVADYISTSIFIFEMCIKIIAGGLFTLPTAYFRDRWNIFDFFVVCLSILDMAFSDLAWVKALRALRSLRAFRMVRRDESLLAVCTALIRALPPLGNLVLINLFVQLIFAIIGVQLFAGKFKQCEDFNGEVLPYNKSECLPASGGVWKNPDVANFDNIFWALLAMFEMASMEMWPDVMLRAVDISDYDQAPIRDNNQGFAIYFLIFIFIGNFIFNNLFTGMVVDMFTRTRAETTGKALLSKEQNQWVELQRMLVHLNPSVDPRPPNARPSSFRYKAFKLVTSFKFDTAIAVMILLNVLVMMMDMPNMPNAYYTALQIANWVFTFIFVLEAIIKMIALDSQYFAEGWNLFDLFIVLISLTGFVCEIASVDVGPILKVFKVFRVMRVVRLVKRAKGIRALLRSASLALPGFFNVLKLLLLVHIVFAVAGMKLFSNLPNMRPKDFITVHANFDTFLDAMLLLFRITTGESYNGVMHDVMMMPHEWCQTEGGAAYHGQCGSWVSVPFFLLFVIISQFVVINLLMATILEEFESVGGPRDEEDLLSGKCPLEDADINEFIAIWRRYLPPQRWYKTLAGTFGNEVQVMSYANFLLVLADMQLKLALDPTVGQKGAVEDIADLAIPVYQQEVLELQVANATVNEADVTPRDRKSSYWEKKETLCVHYYDVMMALCRRVFYQAKIKRMQRAGLRDKVGTLQDFDPTRNIDSSIQVVTMLSDRVTARFVGKQKEAPTPVETTMGMLRKSVANVVKRGSTFGPHLVNAASLKIAHNTELSNPVGAAAGSAEPRAAADSAERPADASGTVAGSAEPRLRPGSPVKLEPLKISPQKKLEGVEHNVDVPAKEADRPDEAIP